MSTNSILSIGYNEFGTHFQIYDLDDRLIREVHVTEMPGVNLYELLEEQALEVIRRIFYPEYQNDAPPTGES